MLFFNDFIPRGLFFDLTDAGNNEPLFDRINGHSTNQIYQLLTQDIYTIQEFRDIWELTYPSVDNNDLFNQYNIN